MTAKWERSLLPELDGSGIPRVGAKARFFDAGTTNPRAVYSDANLTTLISQPVLTDNDGRWPAVFVTPGVYKFTLTDALDVPIAVNGDNTDPGLATSTTGFLPVAQGGTGAGTPDGARGNLLAASQIAVDNLTAQLSTVQSNITTLVGQVAARLPLTGGTLTGPLVLPADATQPLQAVTKQQLDASINTAADFKLITTTVLTAGATEAVFDLSGPISQGYRTFELVLAECKPTATAFMYLEVSPNNSSWTTSGYNGNITITLLSVTNIIAPTAFIPLTHTAATRDQQAGSSYGLSGRVQFYGDGVVNKAVTVETSYPLSGGPPDLANVRGTIGVSITNALNRVRVYYSGTSFASGRVQLWGRK